MTGKGLRGTKCVAGESTRNLTEREKGTAGVKWIKRQEKGRKCEGGNERLG